MYNGDPLTRFAAHVTRCAPSMPPRLSVAPQVLFRIRGLRTGRDRTLTLMAAASCCAAIVVVLAGMRFMPVDAGAIEAIFEIVPPIGLP